MADIQRIIDNHNETITSLVEQLKKIDNKESRSLADIVFRDELLEAAREIQSELFLIMFGYNLSEDEQLEIEYTPIYTYPFKDYKECICTKNFVSVL